MIAFVFPGQGAQARGMGKGLFGEIPEFAAIESEADALLGCSVRSLCFEDPANLLNQTRYTQPCVYIVNALHYYQAIRQGLRPDFVAGHSVGEFNALLAAGVFDLMTGLRLVMKRGELMSLALDGGMAAVVGITPERVSELLRENGLTTLEIANFNTPTQTVISGSRGDIAGATAVFESVDEAIYKPLQVSGAFHSRHMEQAARAFAEFLAPLSFALPSVTVIGNVTARPYPGDDPSETKSMLVRHMTHPVRWSQTVQYLRNQGVTQFSELGHGTVLTRLIKQNAPPVAA